MILAWASLFNLIVFMYIYNLSKPISARFAAVIVVAILENVNIEMSSRSSCLIFMILVSF